MNEVVLSESYYYKVKSPSRLDLSGGTLDCWPLYLYFSPVSTINVSINIYTEVELSLQEKGIGVELPGLNKKYFFSSVEECLQSKDKYLSLLQVQLKFWKPRPGVCFKIIMNSSSPIGAGLGSSSSLCISLLKAFQDFAENNFCNVNLDSIVPKFCKKGGLSINEMTNLAANLEAQVLKMPTGTQDYFPAIEQGLHIIDYGVQGFKDNLVKVPYLSYLEEHLVLVYTGQPHNSGISNWRVIRDYFEGSAAVSGTLQGLAEVSEEMKNLLVGLSKDLKQGLGGTEEAESFNFSAIPVLFSRELELRQKLNVHFVTEEIKSLRDLSLSLGGQEIKVCGAGAGGCVLVWVEPKKKYTLQESLKKHKYKVLDFNFLD